MTAKVNNSNSNNNLNLTNVNMDTLGKGDWSKADSKTGQKIFMQSVALNFFKQQIQQQSKKVKERNEG